MRNLYTEPNVTPGFLHLFQEVSDDQKAFALQQLLLYGGRAFEQVAQQSHQVGAENHTAVLGFSTCHKEWQ